MEPNVESPDDVVLLISPTGQIRSVYTDGFPYEGLGRMVISRAGLIEWESERSGWVVTLPDGRRSPAYRFYANARRWERETILENI